MKRILDKNGKPIDGRGEYIGWPYRSGQLDLVNGGRMVVKSQLIEIVIPSQVTPVGNYIFPDQPNLRNANVWSLEFYSAATLPISPLSGNAVVTQTMMNYMFLTAQDYSSFNFLQLKPCRSLQTINDTITTIVATATNVGGAAAPGKNFVDGMVGQHINWPVSSITFSDPTKITANTALSILVEVFYTYSPNWQADGLGSEFGKRN